MVNRAVDDLLGRTFLFHEDGYTIKSAVTIIAHDPDRGWRLDAGKSFTQAWVSDAMLNAMLVAGILS